MPVDPLLQKMRAALDAGTLVKLTLSEPTAAAEPALRNIYVRLVELREGARLSFVWRYATRDVTKNLGFTAAAPLLEKLLETEFRRAHLFTTTGDWKWKHGGALKAARPTFTSAPPPEHDRSKPKELANAGFLQALGITNPDGTVRPAMADKYRQIERFVELLGHLVDDSSLRGAGELRALDLGAGKGYLTFAAHEFFCKRKVAVSFTGLEARVDLVELTNRVAQEQGCTGLNFVAGRIADYDPGDPLDLLVALHACDTATDDAIHLGIKRGAALIVTAPCCHQEVRPQLAVADVLEPVISHGILAAREADIVTDAVRALLLEIHGYKATVFEFISDEHTGKNLMIAAHRRVQPRDPAPLRAKLHLLLDFFGIREQRLARLLGELPRVETNP